MKETCDICNKEFKNLKQHKILAHPVETAEPEAEETDAKAEEKPEEKDEAPKKKGELVYYLKGVESIDMNGQTIHEWDLHERLVNIMRTKGLGKYIGEREI